MSSPFLLLVGSPDSLLALQQARELVVGRGMTLLAGWALLNLAVSGFLALRTERQRAAFHFHVMNTGWGLVNALLAGASLLGPKPTPLQVPALAPLLAEQLRLENLLLFNAGLDVAYVMTGFWLRARASQPGARQPERLAGYGHSLWVQGGFLLLFDAGFWLVVRPFGAQLLALLP